jgi:uncharacterized membrane protein YeaQ/YmgE (transglycosylase-associated protein family)
MIAYLLVMALTGLVVGAFARLALPCPDPMTLLQTMMLGLAGSFLAGLVVYAISDGQYGAGITVSILVSALILYFIRRSRGGGLMSPGRVERR